jgi:hypothetical protein
MADELTVAHSIAYSKNGETDDDFPSETFNADVSGSTMAKGIMSVATSDTTIDLGTLSAPLGVGSFKNMDSTNYIEIKVAAAGTIIAKLLPGETWSWRLGSGISAPVAIANSAACNMRYRILPP